MDEQHLLTGGGHLRADWEKAAAGVLRKAGRMGADDPDDLVWRKLTRTTLDGIEVPPLGVRDDLDGLADPGLPGAPPYAGGSAPARSERGGDVRARLADPDPGRAAADALLDLGNGVTSLWLGLGRGGIAVDHLSQVLEDVPVEH